MLCKQSKVYPCDNTGIKKGRCIQVYKNISKVASISDLLLFSIMKVKYKKKYIKKKLYIGLVVSVKKKKRRLDGTFLKLFNNRVIVLSETFKFLGSKVKGPISREVRDTKAKRLKFKGVFKYTKGYI